MSEKGKYRIHTVAEMTGVPAATLRAWERRYGLPSPDRTSSSYRLYSDQDVDLIQRLRELCDAGMAPSEAVKIVMTTLAEEATPAREAPDPFAVAQQRVVAAAEAFDPDAIQQAVYHAMVLGPAAAIFDRILGPALREIGRRWCEGTFSVAQEHMASEIIGVGVRDVLRLVQPDSPRRVVLACFADEEHVLPLYGAAFRFAEWGFRTILLGMRTPPAALADAVEALQPEVVGLSVTVEPTPPRARELVAAYADACRGVAWVVGGKAAEALRPRIEAAGGTVVTREQTTELKATIEGAIARHRRGQA